MKMQPTNWRAKTLYPNTPETDTQELVMHVVSFNLGDKLKQLNIEAECPMSAIDNAKQYISRLSDKQIREHIAEVV